MTRCSVVFDPQILCPLQNALENTDFESPTFTSHNNPGPISTALSNRD